MDSREEVEARAVALYGEVPGPVSGVLHVVAAASEGPALTVLRLGEHSPKSPTDFFVLQLARARSSAIVISGSVLRAEPDLCYELPGEGFNELRGHVAPPWLLVLTRSGDLPREHPVWESWVRPIVYTGDAPLDLPPQVAVVRDDAPTPRRAIRHLFDDRGCRGVSIEAGPRVAVPLYDEPMVVNEMMLSTFEGELAPEARGGRFLDEPAIEDRMRLAGGPTAVDEASGRWTFRRYLRA